MPKSDLPFGSEFSPSQISLPKVLELALHHGGNWKNFEMAVKLEYFQSHSTSDYNRGKLANNTKLGMQAYGIIDENASLTEFGKELYGLRKDNRSLYDALAKHILLNLHGSTLVQCIQDVQAEGTPVTLNTLRDWLEQRGVIFPRGGKHPSIMRLWLEKAGVFVEGWRINETKLAELRGLNSEEFEALAKLPPAQRFFLKALLNLGTGGSYPSNQIEKLATATYGQKYNEKGLAKDVLYPLEKAGYITLKKLTRAKPPVVTATPKVISEVYEPLLEQLEKQTTEELRPLLRKPFGEILDELKSDNIYTKGLALEGLAFKLMRIIDLDYVKTRLRGTATGGAEVDVIFQSSRLVFSRWQVQCKNTSRVSLDDVAKEVGLTHLLKSNVIVMVGTGTVGPEARRYANKMMSETNLCVVMVDGADVKLIASDPVAFVEVLNREARHAMKLKVIDVDA
jgi:site-specific DNA-methyltransferase (cytosine-N4-specific)